jgi:hypothetical protein
MSLYWTDRNDRRWLVCSCLKEWLSAYEAELLRRGLIHTCLDLFQTIGGYSKSAGTHSSGGAADTAQFSKAQIRVARKMGAAAWHRTPEQGFIHHCHLVLHGCPHAAPAAKGQVEDYKRGYNGLVGKSRRREKLWPRKLRTYTEGIAWAKAQAAKAPKPAPAPPSKRPTPAQFLGLGDDWKITLPTGRKNHPTEIKPPALERYSHPDLFHLNAAGDGVVFYTPAKGVTTKGSTYTRTEARELRNGKVASWDTAKGTNTLKVEASIGHLPPGDGGVVIAQIHDADDDRVMIRAVNYKGRARLIAEFGRGKGRGGERVHIGDVSRDTRFTFQIHASAGVVVVSLNGANVTKRVVRGGGQYFKFGSYLIAHSDFGEVTIHAAKVTHS